MMKYHFGYSITEVEEMLPYERELYIDFTLKEMQREANDDSG